MMRLEFLQFLSITELCKLSLLSKQSNKFVDPNREIVDTDGNGVVLKCEVPLGKCEFFLSNIVDL